MGIASSINSMEKEENEKEEETSKEISKALVHSMPDATPQQLEKQIEATQKSFELMGKFIKANLKQGVDYVIIEYQNKRTGQMVKTKPFLAKPGSEKFTILFGHRPTFKWINQDFVKGIFSVKCLLVTKKGKEPTVVGEGFGSAKVGERPTWTENEAMKMACKRAQIDASLRTYGLSEHFTQDEESMTRKPSVSNQRQYSQPGATWQRTGQSTGERQFNLREDGSPVTQGQINMLFGTTTRLGHDKKWLEDWIYSQGKVQGVENLTKYQASKFIDVLLKQEKKQGEFTQKTFGNPATPQGELPTIEYETDPVEQMPEDGSGDKLPKGYQGEEEVGGHPDEAPVEDDDPFVNL